MDNARLAFLGHRSESEYIGPYLRCPQYKVLPYSLQGIGKFMGEPVGLKDHNSSYSENGVVPDVSLSSNFYATPNGGYSRPVYPQEFSMWSTFYPNFHKVLQSPLFPFEPQLYSFMHPAENQYQYVPLQMFSQGFTHDFPSQEFQYFVVIDFEATCDKEKIPHPQEIIEFPSVLVNGMTGQVEDFFQSYVRPAVHQHLSDFCKELTGIQQNQQFSFSLHLLAEFVYVLLSWNVGGFEGYHKDGLILQRTFTELCTTTATRFSSYCTISLYKVDRGVPLKEALSSHDKWLEERGIKNKNFAVVTWSNWDCRVMLDSECRFKGLDKPQYFNKFHFGRYLVASNAISKRLSSWQDLHGRAELTAALMTQGTQLACLFTSCI
ncbi:hypothetical protein Syun_001886 [Stephania yunnanensis]|uniref:Exonuclease domain-containing protein n=1 Tax=Stephania yunnanensis TaxID=152371 RepID=A0AAP0LES8_9MAGN